MKCEWNGMGRGLGVGGMRFGSEMGRSFGIRQRIAVCSVYFLGLLVGCNSGNGIVRRWINDTERVVKHGYWLGTLEPVGGEQAVPNQRLCLNHLVLMSSCRFC